MKRNIYEVYAKVCDANGTWNTLPGYPKVFDSKLLNNDIEKAKNRALGEFHACLGTMYPRDDRQMQMCMVIDANAGGLIAFEKIGEIADLPDPEPEQEG